MGMVVGVSVSFGDLGCGEWGCRCRSCTKNVYASFIPNNLNILWTKFDFGSLSSSTCTKKVLHMEIDFLWPHKPVVPVHEIVDSPAINTCASISMSMSLSSFWSFTRTLRQCQKLWSIRRLTVVSQIEKIRQIYAESKQKRTKVICTSTKKLRDLAIYMHHVALLETNKLTKCTKKKKLLYQIINLKRIPFTMY